MKDFVVPVLLAVIGLAATLLGAVVGARAARFGAEKNAETARRQIQDQGAVEHGHWLRQQRLSAFENFLEAWDECLRINQASRHDDSPQSLEALDEATGRMTERARRIALLGPEEVALAAEDLTQTMHDDLRVSRNFIEAADAAITAIDQCPIPDVALTEAEGRFEMQAGRMAELLQAYRAEGRELGELEGHPALGGVLNSGRELQQASQAAVEALQKNVQTMSAALGEAEATVDSLKHNEEAREQSRDRFTRAAREALGTPPSYQ